MFWMAVGRWIVSCCKRRHKITNQTIHRRQMKHKRQHIQNQALHMQNNAENCVWWENSCVCVDSMMFSFFFILLLLFAILLLVAINFGYQTVCARTVGVLKWQHKTLTNSNKSNCKNIMYFHGTSFTSKQLFHLPHFGWLECSTFLIVLASLLLSLSSTLPFAICHLPLAFVELVIFIIIWMFVLLLDNASVRKLFIFSSFNMEKCVIHVIWMSLCVYFIFHYTLCKCEASNVSHFDALMV